MIVCKELCGDGSLSAFSKCTASSCVTCLSYIPTDYFSSTVTHRLYKANNKEWPSVLIVKQLILSIL